MSFKNVPERPGARQLLRPGLALSIPSIILIGVVPAASESYYIFNHDHLAIPWAVALPNDARKPIPQAKMSRHS